MVAWHCFLLFQIGHSQNVMEGTALDTAFGKGSSSLPLSEVVVDLAPAPLPSTCWDRDVLVEAMGKACVLAGISAELRCALFCQLKIPRGGSWILQTPGEEIEIITRRLSILVI